MYLMLQVLVKNYDVYNIRPTFFNGNTLHKLLCKPKGRTARENKNNIGYKIGCSNCRTVYFGEYKVFKGAL